jgi:hypothetical protein
VSSDSETRSVEERLRGFGRRLDEMLARGRIRRADKRAKAEAALAAVEELVEGIESDIEGSVRRDLGRWVVPERRV